MRSIFSGRKPKKEAGTLGAVDKQYGSKPVVSDDDDRVLKHLKDEKDVLKFLNEYDVAKTNVETLSLLCGKHRRKYPNIWTNNVFNTYAERISKSQTPPTITTKTTNIRWKDEKNADGKQFGRLFNKHLIVKNGNFEKRFDNAKLSKDEMVYSQIGSHNQFEFFYPCRVVRCRDNDYYDLLFERSASSYVRKNVYRPDIRISLGGSLCRIL